MTTNKLPKYLLDQLTEGNVVLFLGSGFSFGAEHKDNKKVPIGQGLSDLLAEKFLDDSYKGQSLMHVSQIAISEAGIFNIQNFIYTIFSEFKPADFHKLVPTFKWKSIYTTNYDFILEDSYASTINTLQELSPVVRNTKDINIFKNNRSVPYYKLHGCLSNINDEALPLILTPDQYLTHKQNRDRLFEKFLEQAWNHIVLFVGFSFSDPDILSILHYVDQELTGKSRFYLVAPHIKDAEAKFWSGKGIESIKMTFEEFIKVLDKQIPASIRRLSSFREEVERPVYSKFSVSIQDLNPTEGFISFLDNDVEYIHRAMRAELHDPKEFYKGYFENWDPIIRNLDVLRDIKNDILSEILLSDHYSSDEGGQFLFLILGHAGAGKSVLLKRIAWDAAVEFDKLCIFYNKFSTIKYENILELHRFSKQRIYMFIDNAHSNDDELVLLLHKAKKDNIPLTIFSSERLNVWNGENNTLKLMMTASYQLDYLSKKEIVGLLALLERHNSLGYLESKSQDERIKILSYRPGFELLVALYEATQGKPLKDIIKDEYDKIVSDQAKSLYLTVCLLHRLHTYARAGLIARVHGISLEKFRSELINPLAHIVFDRLDYRIQDFVYQTRHPYIAELVVENVLTTQDFRFDEYIRILNYLDVDFQSDRLAFVYLTNAKKLMQDFGNPDLIRNIYKVALTHNRNNPNLLQQMAIFESEKGSLNEAEKLIKLADNLTDGKDPVIQHTFAELEIRKAELSKNSLEKERYLNQAIHVAEKLTKLKNPTAHGFHTILKSIIMKLELSMADNDEPSIERLIKEFERKLGITKQTFPYHDFILEIEARFNELFNDRPAALELLEKAHELNPASPFIASRLVALLEAQDDIPKISKVLERSMKHLAGDKEINYLYAQFLLKTKPDDFTSINHYLSRSYTEGDNRHFAQFQHARNLFLSGDHLKAKEKFKLLGSLSIDPEIKNRVSLPIEQSGILVEYKGKIKNKEYSYGFITRELYGDDIYFFRPNDSSTGLNYGDKVKFNIAFNYKGLIAINISKIQES